MKVGIITQARTTSTRLPGKVLLEVGGRTLLDHHLDRLGVAGHPVLVATTTNRTDDPITKVAETHGVPTYRGSEQDVLSRFAACAESAELDVVVRVTSDCPLVDGAVLAAGIDEYLAAGDPDLYLSNTLQRTFPRGFDFEVFSATALAEADRAADFPAQREHVTPYLYANVNGRTRLRNVRWHQDRSRYRVTVDTDEDLAVVTALIEDHDAARLGCGEIIEVLDRHPELVALNAQVEQKRLR